MQISFRRLALVGCGLMGGSFALALRDAGLVDVVAGFSRPHSHAVAFHRKGIIDEIAISMADAVSQADLVMVAVPVAAMPRVLDELAGLLPDGVLLMDVSSTKRSVVAHATKVLGRHLPDFVPAHPIAGKERAGPGEPFAGLYHDRQIILTPLESTNTRQVDCARMIWTALGARVTVLTPAAHDRGLAAVSHLPHLLAFAYMSGLLNQPDSEELLGLGGPGFRDFSRIAGCEPTVWQDILRDNRDQTLEQLAAFRQALDQFEQAMAQDDPAALASMLQRAYEARLAWRPAGDTGSVPA